jgi:hypothetical protein
MRLKLKAMFRGSAQNDKSKRSVEREPESTGGVSLRGQSPPRCRSPLLTDFLRLYTVYQCSGHGSIYQSSEMLYVFYPKPILIFRTDYGYWFAKVMFMHTLATVIEEEHLGHACINPKVLTR